MELSLTVALQIVLALGLINVWIFRSGTRTRFRGREAENLKSEFEAYGLPSWAFYLIGSLKLALAASLIAGVWMPALILPSTIMLASLMVGALLMHLRVKDPMIRSLPASVMLALCAALFVI